MCEFTAKRIAELETLYPGNKYAVVGEGRKYDRICLMQGIHGTAVEFVEIATGEIRRAATWNSRGSVVCYARK